MSSRQTAPSERVAAPAKLEHHGRNGFEHERVTDIQRARMLAAMAEVCAERGAANVTVAHVVARSGVSRRTFYEQFTDREDCFLAALNEALACAARYVLPAYETPGRWRERVRTGLIALLSFLEDEPNMGRLLVVETLGAGERALARRQHVLSMVLAALDEGRGEAKGAEGPPPLTAEGVAGSVLSVLLARLAGYGWADAKNGSLLELTGQLMSMIVLPYLGSAAARRELQRAVPARDHRWTPAPANPLRELEMRLTYRTVRVLLSIAALPGASNRELGAAADISDQGQISKLLTRLERLGLIENTGEGHARGAPNAWRLTGRGMQIERAVAQQVTGASHGR
jgi:AcrR family transcriptional regulator